MNVLQQAPLLRRNGTRLSCEPCRRLKYRCDHVMPVCERCRRRKISDQCRYSLTPMMSLAAAKSNREGRSDRGHSSAAVGSSSTLGEDSLSERAGIRLVSPQDPGFLGSTSHSAILAENQSDADLISILQSQGTGSNGATDFDISCIGSRRMKQAFAVLELLNSFTIFDRMIKKYKEFEIYTSMTEYFVHGCVDSVRTDIIQAGILTSKDATRLTAERLFQNTCKSVSVPATCTLAEFAQLFTGASLRWEALTIFFTACGLLCCAFEPSHPIFEDPPKDKYKLLHQLYDASRTCVSFCEDAGPLSDLGIWVHYEHAVLSCQVLGYTHYLVWNHMGATTNHIIAQGLHIDAAPSGDTPPWLIEMRRRGVACAYVLDKLFCRLFGRPPRLSQRYCSIRVPLDLGISQLAAESLSLGEPSPEIGASGWNTSGPQEKSYLRCLVMCSKITEEALELSIGPLQDDLQSRAGDAISRNQALLASIPRQLRYDADVDITKEPLQVFKAAQEYLGFLHNEFMLQRTLCRHLGNSTGELLRLSHRMLSVVLEVSNVRSPLPSTGRYAPWINVFFGLPPAGVLALELLRHRRQQRNSMADFARGQIIQDLSVLVSNLKWIYPPGDGNYQLAYQARRSLQQILNAVLADSPNFESTSAPLNSTDYFDEPDQNMDNFLWLANSGFDTEFWANLPNNLA